MGHKKKRDVWLNRRKRSERLEADYSTRCGEDVYFRAPPFLTLHRIRRCEGDEDEDGEATGWRREVEECCWKREEE